MKLKTLKDINGTLGNGKTWVDFEELKQEAIKWVKKEPISPLFDLNVVHWIKYFFNITEDDLKLPETYKRCKCCGLIGCEKYNKSPEGEE